MSKVLDEINDALQHDGTPRHSGRYPYGSGKNPFQRSGDFLSRVESMSGKSTKQIADELGMSSTSLLLQMRVAKHERRDLLRDRAISLREDGLSLNEIAAQMGYSNDSSVRSLLNPETAANKNKAKNTAEVLKKVLIEKGGMLDVGKEVNLSMGVSPETIKEALFILETEGYNVYKVGIPQVNANKQQSNTSVLTLPDVLHKDVYNNMDKLESVDNYHSVDGGLTMDKLEYPATLSSKRVDVLYGDQGGKNKDGTMEIRRGVDDLSLGNSHYAQIRVLVDDTHYLKGMAVYSDDLPPGVDIRFNTNKPSTTPKMDVFKKIKVDDPDNPFGAYIKADGQSHYVDKHGKRKLSPINKLKEEGDWNDMSKNLSSQFLSKQPMQLINKQLDLTFADAAARFDEINSLTNPTVKKKMLLDFAHECEGAAVHLKAAALPRQRTQVLLPLNGIKDTEIFAPNYKNGEQVALVRYPHGGTFEIPLLTVNNRNKSGLKAFGKNLMDAVGINSNVAERLSGADFDGDQVVVIPTNSKVRIKSEKALKGLVNFDPKYEYPNPPGVKRMTKANTGKEMGIISNLITDMTLKGANEGEITRAVKHSMVVIDAEKHNLDYRQSYKDNRIKTLQKRYQTHLDDTGKEVTGASTLLSRRKQTIGVDERRGSGVIDYDVKTGKGTGKLIYKTTGNEYIKVKTNKRTGVVTETVVKNKTKVNLFDTTDDVNDFSSGTLQEKAYASYANKMKQMSNDARIAYKKTGNLVYSRDAKVKYDKEVQSLNARLNIALQNAPKERRAQAIANGAIKAKITKHPEIKSDKKALKKLGQMEIQRARESVGAHGKTTRIEFSDKEWEAVQAGAVTDSKLAQYLRYADGDNVQKLAMPKTSSTLSPAAVNRIEKLKSAGHTNEEIAAAMGKSISTVSKYLNL